MTIKQIENGPNAFKIAIPVGRESDPAHTDFSLEPEVPEDFNGEQQITIPNQIISPEDSVILDDPRYPIRLWNVKSRAEFELPRCNNSLEAFNGVLKVRILYS